MMATAPDPGGQQNPGLMQAMFANLSPTGGGSIDDILQQAMFGLSGRKGLTDQPLVGILPRWFKTNPQLVAAVRAHQLDPYLAGGGKISDTGQVPDGWRVFTGTTPRVKVTGTTNANVAENHKTMAGDNTDTASAVKNQPYLWSQDQVAEAIKKFQAAGATNVTDFDSLTKAWSGLVDRAAATYSLSSGQRKVTPWDVLDLYKNEMTKAGTLGGGSGGSGGSPSTVTQRTRSVSTITNGDGWSVLQNTLSRMLGRDPSDEEVRDFVGRMNHLAAANPTISTSTTTGVGTAHQSTSSHTKAGFDQNDILQNAYQQAQENPDYAEVQSATTYFNSALSALGAIGG